MEKKGSTKTKFTVIVGYVLVMSVMAFGLIALYNNLVDYSNKKINNQDLSELLVVSNTLSLLYEIESEQNLITPENAGQYFQKYDSIVPIIHANLDELKVATADTARVVKLDSIALLVGMKKENLQVMAVLLDSIRRSPRVLQQTESSYVPRELNREISDYLESKNLKASGESQSDTSVVAGERRRFLERVRNVFDGRADSTIVIESKSVVTGTEFRLIVDTIINKVRYSEKLDLERQRHFQEAFFKRQDLIIQTNRLLTGRIDDLLKEIEQEEMVKSVQLLMDKEEALTRSEDTMQLTSLAALLIALVFGVLFLLDINKSHRYRKQLEASNRRVSDLLAARERLMLTISHDIKAPMSSILGYLELMNGMTGDEASKQRKVKEYLANMEQSGQHVLQLVSTLLDHHKLESGMWQMKESNVNLRSLVNETALSFEPLATRKGLEYQVDNELPEALACYADPYMMRQVMSNLISNAIKYTPEGSVRVKANEEVKEGHSCLIFQVTDTGPGIDLKDQQVIFQDFKQLNGSPDQSGRVEGSGLGLAIAKGFVEEMKGSIRLESEKDSGSEFTVELLLEPAREVSVLEGETSPVHENTIASKGIKKMEGLTVLVVDDDPVQLKMTTEMLTAARVKGVTEDRPGRVLPLLKEQRFDLLLIDLQMPGTDGFMLIKKIREAGSDAIRSLPIIALSARPDTSEAELQEVGFTGFLTKPFTSQQLYQAILRYTGNKEMDKLSSNGASLPGKVTGVEALIDFVKEDKEASMGILQSFVTETTRHVALLKAAFAKKDTETLGKVAHTILPLVQTIGNDLMVSRLKRLEAGELLLPDEEPTLVTWLEEQVQEAIALIRSAEGDNTD